MIFSGLEVRGRNNQVHDFQNYWGGLGLAKRLWNRHFK